jgi:hypothetical protein
MNTVFEKAEIYKETGGVHAAGLFTPEAGLICLAEDIGRHNTLDKLIGYTVINDIDRSNTFIASTGRMASEMVVKICRANIPIVATKTAITATGIELGERRGDKDQHRYGNKDRQRKGHDNLYKSTQDTWPVGHRAVATIFRLCSRLIQNLMAIDRCYS